MHQIVNNNTPNFFYSQTPASKQNCNFDDFLANKNGDFPCYIPIFRYGWLKYIIRKKNELKANPLFFAQNPPLENRPHHPTTKPSFDPAPMVNIKGI